MIETQIEKHLSGEMKKTALTFVEYLKANELTLYQDTCGCWKDKIYYRVKLGDECVCFIAVKDPDEPDNLWTVWSDDSSAYENASVSDEIKDVGWQYVDHCGNCSSCGGKEKVIFGKSFPRVCGCTFRIDNATQEELPFLKVLVILRVEELIKQETIKHYDLLIDTNNDPVHDPKPLQYLLIDGEFHGASVGHFRNGPYDLNDVVCDLPDAETRKEEIIEAIKAVNFGKMPQRFMGKELP